MKSCLFAVPALSLFTGGAAAGMRSMLSKQVGPTEQGKIFSAIATIEATTNLVSQVGFNTLFSATVDIEDGRSFFYVGMAFSLVVILLVGAGALDKATAGIGGRAMQHAGAIERKGLLVQEDVVV